MGNRTGRPSYSLNNMTLDFWCYFTLNSSGAIVSQSAGSAAFVTFTKVGTGLYRATFKETYVDAFAYPDLVASGNLAFYIAEAVVNNANNPAGGAFSVDLQVRANSSGNASDVNVACVVKVGFALRNSQVAP